MSFLGTSQHLDVQTRIVELLDVADILAVSTTNSSLYHVIRGSFNTQARLYVHLQAMRPARTVKFDKFRDLIAAQEKRLHFAPTSIQTVEFAPSIYDVVIQGGVLALGEGHNNLVRIVDGKKAFLPIPDHPHYGIDGDVRITMQNTNTFDIFQITCEQIPFEATVSLGSPISDNYHHASATYPVITLVNAPLSTVGSIKFAPGNLALISVVLSSQDNHEEAIIVLDWQAGEVVHVISRRTSWLTATPADDHGIFVYGEDRNLIYVPLQGAGSSGKRLSGPTFDWAELRSAWTDDARTMLLHRAETASPDLVQLFIEDRLHMTFQRIRTDLSPKTFYGSMGEPIKVTEWMESKRKIRHVAGMALRLHHAPASAESRQTGRFLPGPTHASIETPMAFRSYLTGSHHLPPNAQYQYHSKDSSCWFEGRLVCLHEYQPGGTVLLRVMDMNPRRNRFVGNAGQGAFDPSFLARFRAKTASDSSLQADYRKCPADFVWTDDPSPWQETLWTIHLPDPLRGEDVRVSRLAMEGDHLVVVCKMGGDDWPYMSEEESEAVHRAWCIEFP